MSHGHGMGMVYRGISPPYQCPSAFDVVTQHMNPINCALDSSLARAHFLQSQVSSPRLTS